MGFFSWLLPSLRTLAESSHHDNVVCGILALFGIILKDAHFLVPSGRTADRE